MKQNIPDTSQKREHIQTELFLIDRPLSSYTVFGLMLIYTLAAAACYTAIKAGLEYSPPFRFAGLRTLIGGISLILLLIVLKKPILPRRDLLKWIIPVGLVSTTITFGFMFSSPEYTGAGIASVLGNAQPLTIIVLVVFLGVIGTGLTTILWFWLLQKYEAGRLSLYLFLIPVFGLFIAFMVFDETFQIFEIIGIVLVISAIGLSVMNDRNHNK